MSNGTIFDDLENMTLYLVQTRTVDDQTPSIWVVFTLKDVAGSSRVFFVTIIFTTFIQHALPAPPRQCTPKHY
jgi:hypothetical protein